MEPFKDQLKRATGNIRKESDKRVRRIALAAFERINTQSPVDEGTFRANWHASFDTLDRGYDLNLNATDVQSSVTSATMKISTQAFAGMVLFICNSVPYAVVLEGGYSKQAPSGVVEPACRLVKAAIDAGRL